MHTKYKIIERSTTAAVVDQTPPIIKDKTVNARGEENEWVATRILYEGTSVMCLGYFFVHTVYVNKNLF